MWASAQSSKPGAQSAKPVKPSATQKPSASTAKRGPLKLSDIGDVVREAARRKRDGSDGAAPVAGVRRFGLTERDLTPGTISDDRQPAYSPTGKFIAFVSNRSNVAGTAVGANYHVWIMERDGSSLRQITGLTLSGPSKDDNVDQWQPTFSTDGNSIAYKSLGLFQSAGTTPVNTRAAGNLFVVQPFVNTTGVPPFEQRTFFQAGDLDRPAYGANGLSIAFGHTGNVDGNLGDTAGEYDVFSISPTGQLATLRRLTGGAADPAGAAAQDRQPAFSLVNPGVLYFTSTRAGGASRIFLMNADGSSKRQISNPTDTVAVDEYPSPSTALSNFNGSSFNALRERVDFQSNRLAAADDTTRDTNIYSIELSTGDLGPPPTPTPQPTPQLVVSAYTGNVLYSYDTTRGGFPTTVSLAPNDASALGNPEGVVFGPDINNDGYPEVLVSNRAKNRIDAYDGVTLTFLDIFAGAGAPTADASLRNPTALLYTGQPGAFNGTLYVASGFGTNNANPPVTTSTNKIHRYTVAGGVATAAPAGGQQGSIFSNGADGVTNGIEGLAIRGNFLYASSLLENKINSYNASTGAFNSNFVAPALGELSLPTGITFGPNGNLFVCSSGSDDVKEYTGPGAAASGDFVQDFVQDDANTNSSNYGLNAPEGIAFGPDGNLYVTALNLPGSNNQFDGSYILRFSGTTPNTPLPAAATGFFFQTRVPGAQQDAVFAVTGPLNGFDPNTGNFGPTNGAPAGLAFFPSAPPPPTPAPTSTPVIPSVVENSDVSGPARLETNPISAPSLVVANRLDPSQEDNAADREATFSRSTADVQTAAQLAFSSTRTRAAQPNAPIVNSNGGPDTSTGGGSDVNRSGGGPAHDIWVTATEDFTPPVPVPVGAGNVLYPVVAPGIQAPFFAPRTPDEGLAPGAPVQIAVVLSEPESGLAQTGSVTAVFYNADQRSFTANTSLVNEKIRVRANLEQKPAPIGSVGLFAYDDGPSTAGGRERQAGAVRGDGLYYCEGTFTPPTQGDFYFDIQTTDLAGNAAGSFLSFDPNTGRVTYSGYDNIWGFSNRPFAKSSTTSDLFVSDYTQGQVFPSLTGDERFLFQSPVESYYLSNPAAIAQVPVGLQPRAATLSNASIINSTQLGGIDVWRVLCRGPVRDDVLQAYTPAPVSVITAPSDSAETDTRGFLASATSCVIWASPYTGTVFAGPGTLADADTQNRLSNFLNNGGRLFVSGRDVVFSLSGGGRVTSSFLRDELQAGYGGEVLSTNRNIITGVGGIFDGRFSQFPDGIDNSPYNKVDLNNLQMPQRNRDVPPMERGENTFLDAALNQSFRLEFADGGGTAKTDIITPSNTNGAIVNSAYEINGNRVAQRIERNNRGANGFQSRAVLFSFGLEGINRRYSLSGGNAPAAFSVEMRALLAENVRRYLKTGGISGTVINNQTNLPVPNFVLEITQGNQRYFARTDERGNYEIQGLPNTTFVKDLTFITSQNYQVRPAVDAQGQSINQGFLNSFAGTPREPFVQAPEIEPNVNFRVIPAPLASVSGVATQSNGTFDLRSDDSVLPNVRVLIRSLRESSLFPGGGRFAQLTLTDAGGRFSFANVPSNTDLELIFNPDGRFESQGGDIPDRSGIVAFTSNSAFGRRRIPDAQRPQRIFFDAADVTTGNNFVLNDGPTDTPANDPLVSNANGIYVSGGPILVPVGRTIAGKVLLNSDPLPGATVTIASSTDPAFNRAASTTTSTGDYAFFDVPSGTYVVTASFTAGDRVLSSSITVTVDTSQANDPIVPNIILRKQAVSGLVTVNGAAPGAPLTVELLDSAGAVVQTQQTNAAGAYVFSDVPAGTFSVRATRNGAAVTSAPFTVSAFNPGPPATGGDVRVPTINISALRLTGVVTLNGVGTAGLQVQVLDAAGRVAGTTTSGAGGAYAFADLLSGQYTLTASAVGRNGTDTASVPVGLDASQANVTVPLFLYSVRGTVRFRGAVAAGQRVEVLQNGVVVATATTNASGGYLIDRLVASPFGTAFQVRASRVVGSVVVDQTPPVSVVVTRGVEQPLVVDVPPLDLVTQIIQGRAYLNGRPVAGAAVQLFQGRRLLFTVRSGAGGVFRFNDVPAGTFILRATFRGDTVDRTVTLQRGATLGANGTADLRLLLQSIRGLVRLNNTPLVGQVVELFQFGRVIQRVRSTRGGVYEFSNLLVRAGARTGYTVRATRLRFTAQGNVLNVTRNGRIYPGPLLVLRSQTIRVTVRLNNVATTGATVELLLGTRVVKRATTGAGGIATFTDLAAGTYTVRATRSGDTAQATVVVNSRVATAANGFTVNVTVNLVLQSIQGTLLANTTPISGQIVSLIQNNRVLATATTNGRGVFTFTNLAAGTYTVRVTRNGLVANRTVTLTRGRNTSITIVLALQSVRGVVTLDGRPTAGINVSLLRGTTPAATAVVTTANGAFTLSGVPAGTYVLTASVTVAGRTATASRTIRVVAGRDTVVPTIALTTPPPNSEDETYQPGSSYQISVPYTNSTAPYSTTTVAQAFTVPPVTGGVENYRLFRFNPLTYDYELLGANSLIRRGEGYFLQPQARGVSIRTPATDRTRLATNSTEFEIRLRVDLSNPRRNNGFNLIGFPFDPARITASTWRNAIVITPQGERLTVAQAFLRGLVDDDLHTLDNTTDQYTAVGNNLVPFQGYYVQTFTDNLRVILRAGDATE